MDRKFWKCKQDVRLWSSTVDLWQNYIYDTGDLAYKKDEVYEEYLGSDLYILYRKTDYNVIFIEPDDKFSIIEKHYFEPLNNKI